MSSIAVFRTSQKSLRRRKNKYNPSGDNFFKQKECCSTSGVKSECKFIFKSGFKRPLLHHVGKYLRFFDK